MYISENIIDDIRDKTDIVDVVSNYVDLRKSGSNFKASCPFHEEKTPSFMVSPEKQIYHCFGCGKGGNVFNFVMEIEGVSFPEAVKTLGKECGVEIKSKNIPDDEKNRNELLYHANDFAARWYHSVLLERSSSEKVRGYLASRGINSDSCKNFKLGATTEGWDDLFKAAKKEGVALDALKELKLVIPREKGGGYFDYFRKRLIFPILSVSGRTIAFGARILAKGVDPKYLNSIESAVFAKRRTFYGMHQARPAIRAAKAAIIVEGYTDCISLHQIGFKNCIASCGTALSSEHASLLRRMTSTAVLMPDGDAAGQMGAVSAGANLLSAGLDVAVARLEEGGDPDSEATHVGKSGMKVIIDEAMDYFEFLNYIIKYRASSLAKKEVVIGRVMEGVARTKDRLHREMLIHELARVFSINEEVLAARAEKSLRYRSKSAARGIPETRPAKVAPARSDLEKVTLRLIMESTSLAEEAISRLDSDDFYQEMCSRLYKLLDLALEKHIDLNNKDFQRMAEDAGVAGLAAEVALITVPPGDLTLLLNDYVKRIKELKIRDELKALHEKLRDLPEESEEAVAVAEYYNRLKIALSQL